jgi:hypothetical protein
MNAADNHVGKKYDMKKHRGDVSGPTIPATA